MRVVIATRIFSPEISAASGILRTWAEEFRDRGFDVKVLTTKPPKGAKIDDPPGVDIRRARVKRDKQHYVRGYLSYMSFDIPLVFRLLFSRKADLYIVEPPPTTVAVVRAVAALRRTPYVVRAADYWAEAAELVTSSRFILRMLRSVEAWGLRGAKILFAAHQPLINRLREVGITTPAVPIGFGTDTKEFGYEEQVTAAPPFFVYAGTYSEWHGAGIFVEALKQVLDSFPGARLAYYGNGEEREKIRALAHVLGLEESVEFHQTIPPKTLSPILSGATASVASVTPIPRNEYAVATKVYSSMAAGCPVIFAGVGPTVDVIRDSRHPYAGVAVTYNVAETVVAMNAAAAAPLQPADRAELAKWSAGEFSLNSIAKRVVDESLAIIKK